MGTVYLAEHGLMGWRAAIKVLRRSLADDKVLVKRFINEAHAVKAIRHPNIIDIIDVGILSDGRPYLLMEFLEGDTLGARLHASGRLSVEQAVDITRQTAAALGAAHDKGIVHRDLKPDNLFLVPDPENPHRDRIKVLDFGIAKLRGADALGANSSPKTKSGVLLGTPAYMSPEQCRGIAGNVDHRTDIYALSVILHQMLAGKAPFVGAGTGDVIIMHVTAPPPPIRVDNPEVPELIEAAILRGLAKERELRFQSMGELAAALQGLAQTTRPIDVDHPAPPPRSATPGGSTPFSWSLQATRLSLSTRRRAWTVGLALLVLLPVGILVATGRVRALFTDKTPPAVDPSTSRTAAAQTRSGLAPEAPAGTPSARVLLPGPDVRPAEALADPTEAAVAPVQSFRTERKRVSRAPRPPVRGDRERPAARPPEVEESPASATPPEQPDRRRPKPWL